MPNSVPYYMGPKKTNTDKKFRVAKIYCLGRFFDKYILADTLVNMRIDILMVRIKQLHPSYNSLSVIQKAKIEQTNDQRQRNFSAGGRKSCLYFITHLLVIGRVSANSTQLFSSPFAAALFIPLFSMIFLIF